MAKPYANPTSRIAAIISRRSPALLTSPFQAAWATADSNTKAYSESGDSLMSGCRSKEHADRPAPQGTPLRFDPGECRKVADRDQRSGAKHLLAMVHGKGIRGSNRERPSKPQHAAADNQPLADRGLQQFDRIVCGRSRPAYRQQGCARAGGSHIGQSADRSGLKHPVLIRELVAEWLRNLEAAGTDVCDVETEMLRNRHCHE